MFSAAAPPKLNEDTDWSPAAWMAKLRISSIVPVGASGKSSEYCVRVSINGSTDAGRSHLDLVAICANVSEDPNFQGPSRTLGSELCEDDETTEL